MNDPHNDAIFSPGIDRQVSCCFFTRLNNQRMVAGGGKRGGQPFKNAALVVVDGAGFAMHGQIGPHGFATKKLVDTLHSQTDPQDGNTAVKGVNQRNRQSGMGRIFGSGADEQVIRRFR